MADFNSNTPTVRGAEWRPSSSRDLLLDASTKGVAMRFRGTAATYSHLHRFVSALQGTPGLGIEILSQLVPTGAGTFTARPNEDVAIGLWTEDDGTTTTIFDQIDEPTLDLGDYIKVSVVTGSGSNADYDFRLGVGSGNLAGKRLSSVGLSVVAAASGFGVVLEPFQESIIINGTKYTGTAQALTASLTTIASSWRFNPATSKPWTIADCELFDTTEEARIRQRVVSIAGGGFVEAAVYQAWMDFAYVTENRLGFLYTTGAPTLGWFEENISDATLSASTYYYVHVFPLAGNASNWFKVPLLKDPNVVMALNAAASTGEHRVAYSTTLDSGNGIITAAQELPGEMMPMLFDVAGTIQAQSNPYCGIV